MLMDSNEALGINNARQQVRFVKSLRAIRELQGITTQRVAESMISDGLDIVDGGDFVSEFELGGMNYTASILRSYAKAIGAELTFVAELPKTNAQSGVYKTVSSSISKPWGANVNDGARVKTRRVYPEMGQKK